MRNIVTLLAATALVAILSIGPWPPRASISIERAPTHYTIHTWGYSGTLVVVSHVSAPPLRSVVIYDDERYASGRGYSRVFAFGLPIHLRAALRANRVTVPLRTIDADGLRDEIASRPQPGDILIDMQGTIPDTITDTRLRRWIESGGTLIWAGEPLGSMRSAAHEMIPVKNHPYPYRGAWNDLYRSGLFDPHWDLRYQAYHAGFVPTLGSDAATIRSTATTYGLSVATLRGNGGWPIGFVDADGKTSVAVLPVGKGHVVLYADGLNYEVAAAQEIAHILMLGLWYRPHQVWSRFVEVHGPSSTFETPIVPKHDLFIYGRNPLGLPMASSRV